LSRPVLIVPGALLAAPAAALAVALPGALRLAGGHVGFLEAWLGAAGLMCPLLAVAVVTSRGARRALGTMEVQVLPLVVGVALWVILAVPATAVLGAMLKANTHHRGLAGATFATFALTVHAGAALVAWRLTANLLPSVHPPAVRTGVACGLGALAIGVAVWAVQGDSMLADGALAFIAVAVAARFDVPGTTGRSSWLGAGALVFVTSVGIAVTARSPSLAGAMTEKAPLAGAVGRTLGLSGEAR
jgi:choline-sulfatase